MGAKELLEMIRRQPFIPLRLHMTDGRKFEVHHPDQLMVLKSVFVIPVGNGTLPDRAEYCSLLHLVRVEELSPASASSN
jgi:hypothetical protein